jgi:hypothetical protein
MPGKKILSVEFGLEGDKGRGPGYHGLPKPDDRLAQGMTNPRKRAKPIRTPGNLRLGEGIAPKREKKARLGPPHKEKARKKIRLAEQKHPVRSRDDRADRPLQGQNVDDLSERERDSRPGSRTRHVDASKAGQGNLEQGIPEQHDLVPSTREARQKLDVPLVAAGTHAGVEKYADDLHKYDKR